MKRILFLALLSGMSLKISAIPDANGPESLVPKRPSTSPDYYCTWNLQGYVCSYGAGAGSNDLRLEINEDNLFGEQLGYKVWGKAQPKTTLTSGQPPKEVTWTVPVRYQGWRSLGGWICAQDPIGMTEEYTGLADTYENSLRWTAARIIPTSSASARPSVPTMSITTLPKPRPCNAFATLPCSLMPSAKGGASSAIAARSPSVIRADCPPVLSPSMRRTWPPTGRLRQFPAR